MLDETEVSSAGLVLSKIMNSLSREQKGSIFGLEGFMANLGRISGPIACGILWDLSGDLAPFLLSLF